MRTQDINTDHDNGRRNALRGLLVVGCGMFLPMVTGCKDRQAPGAPQGAPDIAGGPPAGAPSAPAGNPGNPVGQAPTESPTTSPNKKMSQAEAQYQGQPKAEKMCASCTHFQATSNTCEVVEGQVSPQGWCKLWTPKV